MPIARGNSGTRATLAQMARLAKEGSADPVVIKAAHDAVRGVRERDDEATMAALLTDVRMRLRYTPDPIDVELVKSPRVVLEESRSDSGGKFVGDCDDASTLLSAMLGAVGLPSRFVVVATDERRGGEWSHVYVSARKRDGTWVPLDPIVRSFGLGQEVPGCDLNGPRVAFPGALGGADMARYGVADYSASDLAQMASGASSSSAPTLTDALNTIANAGAAYVKAKYAPAPVVRSAGPLTVKPPGFFSNADGSTNWTKVALVGAGVVLVGGLLVSTMRRRR